MQNKGEIKCYETGLLLNEFIKQYPIIQLLELQKGLGVQYSYSQKGSKTIENIEVLEEYTNPNSLIIFIKKEILPIYSPFKGSTKKVFLNVIIFLEIDFLIDLVHKELINISARGYSKIFKDLGFLEKMREMTSNLIQNLEVSLFSTQLPSSFFEAWVYKYLYELSNAIFETINPRSIFIYKHDDLEKIQYLESMIKNTRFNSMPTIAEMAESVGMSPTKFKKIFKEVFGLSTRQYILQVKTKQAQSLVKSNNHSLAQIAHQLGFSSKAALIRLLKNKV